MMVSDGLIEAIVGTASDAVATDRTGIIDFWNPGADRIFGFRADEAIGRSLDLIIPHSLHSLRARHWAGFDRVMETGVSRYDRGDLLSVPALTRSGQRISVEPTIVLLKDEKDHSTGTLAILRDVTTQFEESRKLKRLRRIIHSTNSNTMNGVRSYAGARDVTLLTLRLEAGTTSHLNHG